MEGGRGLVVMMVVAITIVMMLAGEARAQGPSPSQCSQERQQGIDLCKSVIFGQAPSAACCGLIRTGHFECACPVIDAKLAALLDIKKVTKLLQDCGRAVPRRFQCGSLFFP